MSVVYRPFSSIKVPFYSPCSSPLAISKEIEFKYVFLAAFKCM